LQRSRPDYDWDCGRPDCKFARKIHNFNCYPQLAQARRIADYVALFWVKDGSGRLIEAGSVKQIFENPQQPTTEAYISGSRG
jgi:hypothetical protein